MKSQEKDNQDIPTMFINILYNMKYQCVLVERVSVCCVFVAFGGSTCEKK